MITEEQIWNYLDGNLSVTERKDFEQLIATDKQATEMFNEISALNLSLKSQPPLSPSVSFTNRVMASLNLEPVYTPARFSIAPVLIFMLPTLLVILILAGVLAFNQAHFTGALPMHIPLPQLKHPGLYFLVIDIVILAYFLESLSEYRFNRKTLFS
jgi:anti-sigma factor RsiW